jgi:Arc/MetJ-type ribon-helix-helix transcriptional regulator
MEVRLTPDQQAFVRPAIAAGRLHNTADAITEALSLWEERERRRAEILVAVDTAEASLARGEGRPITQESMQEVASEVERRGRARLAVETEWRTALRRKSSPSLTISGNTLPVKRAVRISPIT